MRRHSSNQTFFSTALKVVLSLVGLYCVYQHSWVGIFVIIPVFFVDYIISKVRTDTVGTLFKLFILFQGLLIWYIASNNFFRSSPLAANEVSSAVLNHPMKFNIEYIEKARQLPSVGSELVEVAPQDRLSTDVIFPSKMFEMQPVNSLSNDLIDRVLGPLFGTDFPDLKHFDMDTIHSKYPTIFKDLPSHFDRDFKNPCWDSERVKEGGGLACLPYAYVLGQPKCGTSDLFERIKLHQQIIMPRRKEVRWFTRGEFMTHTMAHEGGEDEQQQLQPQGHSSKRQGGPNEKALGPGSSLYSFARSFSDFTNHLSQLDPTSEEARQLITIDGGPHTLWWPTQSPDGSFLPEEVPPNQLVAAIQPQAKFIITVNNPVTRMYSDYHFLGDDLKPVRNSLTDKSPTQFHERAEAQVTAFRACVSQYISDMKENNREFIQSRLFKTAGQRTDVPIYDKEHRDFSLWFRASQMCAHDRHRFGVAGHGRITIGLYVLFYEKWLEYFTPSQFIVTRLENYRGDPKAYLQRIFDFLGLTQAPDDWDELLNAKQANVHRQHRAEMLPETHQLLSDFYRPYNLLFAQFLNNPEYAFSELNTADKGEDEPDGNEEEPHEPFRQNQHGLERHMEHDPHAADSHNAPPHSVLREGAEVLKDALGINTGAFPMPGGESGNLRGYRPAPDSELVDPSSDSVTLVPRSFDTEGLPEVPSLDTISTFNLLEPLNAYDVEAASQVMLDPGAAAHQLAISTYGLDLAAVKFLLYDVGVPPNLLNPQDNQRTAIFSIAMIHTMADAHSKSHLFALLKGKPSWVTPHLDPEMHIPIKQQSPIAMDVLTALSPTLLAMGEWLLRAGADASIADSSGHTPLHHAAYGGQFEVVKWLLERAKVPVDPENHEMRTPLHFATAYGHVNIVKILMEHGADIHKKDQNGVCAFDIISNPGVISQVDAKNELGIEQRDAKQINRQIHPEFQTNDSVYGWEAGTGGWGPERLKGFEQDMDCKIIDQYWAHEITGDEVYERYILRNAPVMIRGLLTEWDVEEVQSLESLLSEHGDLEVQVSDIPYAIKFGGAEKIDMKLSEYIQEVRDHRMVGGNHPWYVFKGHPVPQLSEKSDSLVKYEHFPTPNTIKKAFELASPPSMRGKSGAKSRDVFVNAQWALGGEGTGAPIHFHNTAWSALLYGAKKWIIYPPSKMIMSNRQILDYWENEMPQFEARGVHAVTCVQTAGDVVIIPESWAHGVLNIQESIAIATEFKQSQWRIRPMTHLFTRFPNFEQRGERGPPGGADNGMLHPMRRRRPPQQQQQGPRHAAGGGGEREGPEGGPPGPDERPMRRRGAPKLGPSYH